MHDQPKYIPLRPSDFFADGRSARPLLEGTVARGHLNDDTAVLHRQGRRRQAGQRLSRSRSPRTCCCAAQQRFNIYCTPCHDRIGNGNGMIVRRGYRQPPTYHIDRLRQLPNGYFYDVITNGFGAMPDYAAQIPPRDRWAIVAYIRALQLSQQASINDVPADARGQLAGRRANDRPTPWIISIPPELQRDIRQWRTRALIAGVHRRGAAASPASSSPARPSSTARICGRTCSVVGADARARWRGSCCSTSPAAPGAW